jgi:hypothetical protein
MLTLTRLYAEPMLQPCWLKVHIEGKMSDDLMPTLDSVPLEEIYF